MYIGNSNTMYNGKYVITYLFSEIMYFCIYTKQNLQDPSKDFE